MGLNNVRAVKNIARYRSPARKVLDQRSAADCFLSATKQTEIRSLAEGKSKQCGERELD
jgi:hypothetical protein